MESKAECVELTADIVAAYVGNNAVPVADLARLINEVHNALTGAMDENASVALAMSEPAVPIRRSVTPDHIVCLEDGKKFKSLKRHLRTHFDLSPEQYRKRWGLEADYPMVAPNYAKARSELAKKMRLGQRGG